MASESMFKEKLGPLPVWIWIAAVTAVGLLYYVIEKARKKTGSTSSTAGTTGTTPSSEIPQFVIQNQFPAGSPRTAAATTSTTTAATAVMSGSGFLPSTVPVTEQKPGEANPGTYTATGATGGKFLWLNPTEAAALPQTTPLYYEPTPGQFVPTKTAPTLKTGTPEYEKTGS